MLPVVLSKCLIFIENINSSVQVHRSLKHEGKVTKSTRPFQNRKGCVCIYKEYDVFAI